jgi:hypothetical protein
MPKKITETNILKQKEILQKIYEILGISSEKKSFILQDMDANEEAQEQIYELEPDIKENFICSSWGCFKAKDQDRKWYNIIKSVCKNNNVSYYAKRKNIKKTDKLIYATEVIIECD